MGWTWGGGRRAGWLVGVGAVVTWGAGCDLGVAPAVFGVPAADVASGDVDGDGDVDLVSGGAGGFAVLLGDGAGGFAAATVGDDPATEIESVDLVDLDADGALDLLTASGTTESLSLSAVEVRLGDGAGGFGGPAAVDLTGSTATTFFDVAVGDLHGDGAPDLLVSGKTATTAVVEVYAGDGAGGFAATPAVVELGAAGPHYYSAEPDGLAVGDVDGDADLDVVSAGWRHVPGQVRVTDELGIARNDGAGSFGPAEVRAVGATDGLGRPQLADVDGDGHVDIVLADPGGSPSIHPPVVRVLPGRGDGTFGAVVDRVLEGTFRGGHEVRVADVDGDGRNDLVGAGGEGYVLFASPTGDRYHRLASGGEDLVVTDLDGDGRPDVVLASAYQAEVAVFLNRFTAPRR